MIAYDDPRGPRWFARLLCAFGLHRWRDSPSGISQFCRGCKLRRQRIRSL